MEFFLAFSFIVRPRYFPWCFHNQFFALAVPISDLQKNCANIGYNCKGNSIDIFRAFSSRDVDMICENWHTHLNCTLGAHCSSCKAAGRILHFCKPLQFMKRSIYVLVVEDQKSINDMHDYIKATIYM